MGKTNISYLTKTWNPMTGCSRASEGCDNCWSEEWHRRFGTKWYPTLHPKKLGEPLLWKEPQIVGVCFQGDLFHDAVSADFIEAVWTIMAFCPQHTFVVLTKRPKKMQTFLSRWDLSRWDDDVLPEIHVRDAWVTKRMLTESKSAPLTVWPLPNVWLMVSVENQERADERIPVLLQTKAAYYGVSLEPQIGPVDLDNYLPRESQCEGCNGAQTGSCDFCHPEPGRSGIGWVIQGCESGKDRRPFEIEWARSVRDACLSAGVAYYLKQVPLELVNDPGIRSEASKLSRGVLHEPWLDGKKHLSLPWENR